MAIYPVPVHNIYDLSVVASKIIKGYTIFGHVSKCISWEFLIYLNILRCRIIPEPHCQKWHCFKQRPWVYTSRFKTKFPQSWRYCTHKKNVMCLRIIQLKHAPDNAHADIINTKESHESIKWCEWEKIRIFLWNFRKILTSFDSYASDVVGVYFRNIHPCYCF